MTEALLQDSFHEHAESLDAAVQPSARRVARECLEKADGDWKRAADLMRAELSRDPDLFRQLMQPMIDQAIWAQIRLACRSIRSTYSVCANADSSEGLVRMARREEQHWLDYPLSGGMKLGDADKQKLLEESERHTSFAVDNQRKADFYIAISKRIGGKRVREAMNEQQITGLAEKILCAA